MLRFRDVSLVPITQQDLPFISTVFGDCESMHLWGHRQACDELQFYDSWRSWSAERMNSKFLVLVRSQPAGIVFDYERNVEDGHTKIATILKQSAVGKGNGIVATALFCSWLFKTAPLRKVYMEVFAFNEEMLRIAEKLGLTEEMRRVEHRFWNGRYWDQYGFSISRNDAPQLTSRLLRRDKRVTKAGVSKKGYIATEDSFDVALHQLASH